MARQLPYKHSPEEGTEQADAQPWTIRLTLGASEAAVAGGGEAITPSEIAREVGKSPKTVRAFLRERFPRSEPEKGQPWVLTRAQIEAVRARFG